MEKLYYMTVTTCSRPNVFDEWVQYEGYDKDEAIKMRDYRNLHECDKEFHTETRVHKLLDDRLYEDLSDDEQCAVLSCYDILPEEEEE